jgi:hypothetical protein
VLFAFDLLLAETLAGARVIEAQKRTALNWNLAVEPSDQK